MRRGFIVVGVLGALAAGAITAGAQSLEERAAARDIVLKRGAAVVTILGSIRMRVTIAGQEMQASDEPLRAMGTVLDASGLTAMSLSTLDPADVMQAMLDRSSPPGAPRREVSSSSSGLRIRLADGKEITAAVVFRDKLMDLAILKPQFLPVDGLAWADGQPGVPQAMDLLLSVQRLDEVGGWQAAGSFGIVQAVIAAPRPAYVVAVPSANGGGLGAPVFDMNGRFVGVLLVRNSGVGGTTVAALQGSQGAGVLPVVVPAGELRDAAKKAAEAK